MHDALMESPVDRLWRAAQLAGYKSPGEIAEAMGAPYQTIVAHLNGSRSFKRQAERYAAFFKVDLTWLLTGRGMPRPDNLQGRILALSPDGQRTIREMIEFIEEREAQRRRAG